MVRGRRGFSFASAIRNVDRNPNQPGLARFFIPDDLGALAQPYPTTVGGAHAKLNINAFTTPARGQLRDRFKIMIIRMHQRLKVRHGPLMRSRVEIENIKH